MSEGTQTPNTTSTLGGDPTPPPGAPPAAPPAAGAGQTPPPASSGTGSWLDALPDELKNEPSIKLFKDPGALAKSYLSAQKMIGGPKIPVPDPKTATEDEWKAVYSKLGLPESPDKYEVKLPEGVQADENFMKGFKELAHKSGILPRQAQPLVEWFTQEASRVMAAEAQAKAAQAKQGIEGLKTEWGAAYDTKIKQANAALSETLGDLAPDFKKFLNESGLGDHPTLIKAFAKMGENLKEDDLKGDGDGRLGAMTPAEAQSKINEIMSNPKHPYNDKYAARNLREAAVEEMRQLFAMKGAGSRSA